MNYRKLISNAAAAFVSQGVSMVASILTSLLVPKLLGVEEFGYWQLFIFYTSYVGLFHLGICDGVYLINGGKSRVEIDRKEINSQFRFAFTYQIIFSLLIALASFFLVDGGNRFFVLCATAVFLLLNNMSTYIGYVFQSMNETRLYSISTILDRAVFAVLLVVLLIIHADFFEIYVFAYALAKMACLVYCIFHFRDFLASGVFEPRSAIRVSVDSIRVGSKLMCANLADMLILGIARALIDANWGIETFGQVSLALSLVSFFVTFMTQFSMVLYPALRQSSQNDMIRLYRRIKNVLGITLPVIYVLYYPLSFMLSIWLPDYTTSMHYLGLLLPICAFNSAMSISSTTYLKVLRREGDILTLNALSVLASILLSLIGIYALSSIEFVLIGCVCVVAFRYLVSARLLNRELGDSGAGMDIWLYVLAVIHMAGYMLENETVAFVLSISAYCFFLLRNRKALVRAGAAMRSIVADTRKVDGS